MNRIGDNLIHFAANEELIRAFVQRGVRFVVVGGLAVAWHCSERQADDMDLLVEPTDENSVHIVDALASLGIPNVPPNAFARNDVQAPLKQVFYAELLTPRTGQLSFVEVSASAVDAKLFGLPVRLASRATLLDMKHAAVAAGDESAAKHLEDIARLRQHDA